MIQLTNLKIDIHFRRQERYMVHFHRLKNQMCFVLKVINTNYCKISVCEDRNQDKVIIISAIDNLLKGGSGQAVQNMNIMFGIDESTGLL